MEMPETIEEVNNLKKMVEELEAQREINLKDRNKNWFDKLGEEDEDRD